MDIIYLYFYYKLLENDIHIVNKNICNKHSSIISREEVFLPVITCKQYSEYKNKNMKVQVI